MQGDKPFFTVCGTSTTFFFKLVHEFCVCVKFTSLCKCFLWIDTQKSWKKHFHWCGAAAHLKIWMKMMAKAKGLTVSIMRWYDIQIKHLCRLQSFDSCHCQPKAVLTTLSALISLCDPPKKNPPPCNYLTTWPHICCYIHKKIITASTWFGVISRLWNCGNPTTKYIYRPHK